MEAAVSLQAISWALDESQASGNDRLVLIVMCHWTQDDGFSGLAKATLADETRLSEATIIRCQTALCGLGEVERMGASGAPSWWLGLRANRRPALFKMVGFLGSHYATPVRRRASKSGVSQGSHGGVVGVSDTPPDQHLRDAISDQRSETNEGVAENRKPPDENCIRCRGKGTFYRSTGDARTTGTGGTDVDCSCTFIEDPALALVGGSAYLESESAGLREKTAQ